MRWTIGVACAIALLSCRRRGDDATIVSDPAPHDATPPKTPAPPGDPSLVLLHGRVIDPVAARVTFTLAPTPPLPKLEASRGDRGYLFWGEDLEAFDLRRGAKLWTTRASCTALLALDAGVICASIRVLDFYDATTGAHRSLASSATADVQQMIVAAGHVLVLHVDGAIESFDAHTLAPAGSSKLRFVAHGWEPLAANDRGACISSDPWHVVELACVDATAKIDRATTHALDKPTDRSKGCS